jgi:ribosome biogenesis GTPase A
MNINWYPGHMKKTKELIKENLKLVDVVVELLDARIPISSQNPEIKEILGTKKQIIALNKYDLADPDVLQEWKAYYREKGLPCIFINSLNGDGINRLFHEIKLLTSDIYNKMKDQGRTMRPIRAMIVGIPNVGKSSLTNKLAGKKSAQTGNRPGVTKGKQWIRINKGIELFDTPGILWPKIEDKKVGINLACTGAIKDEILHIDEIALKFIEFASTRYPELLINRYKIDNVDGEPLEIMEKIAKKRGCISKGNEIDYDKVSNIILDEFRKGIIGCISMESPDDIINENQEDDGGDDE